MRLFDGWRFISAIGAFLCIVAMCSMLEITEGYYTLYLRFYGHHVRTRSASNQESVAKICLGLAIAIQYITLLDYLRYSTRFSALSLVLWGAFFKVQRIFFSVLPLAMGLLLFGMLIFSLNSDSFGDFQEMIITSFSIMNCDSIWQTCQDTVSIGRIDIIGKLVDICYSNCMYITYRYI
jgi:hypothetical protein